MSAWQFSFVCSRVLGAWLATSLVSHVAMLAYSLSSFFQTVGMFEQTTGALQAFGSFGPAVFNLLSLALISLLFWFHAGTFANYVTAAVEDSSRTDGRVFEWERPVVFLAGLWLLTDAVPGLGGLAVNFALHSPGELDGRNPFWSLPDNLIAAGEYGVKLLLGLLIMVNAKRLALWTRGDFAARLRPPGAAQPPDDPAA